MKLNNAKAAKRTDTSKRGSPWSPLEVAIACHAYAAMLACEKAGEKYSKAAVKRQNVPLLDGRSAGSWEAKCMNISAALVKLGFKPIKGYKPLPGYQKALEPAILAAMRQFTRPEFIQAVRLNEEMDKRERALAKAAK